MFTFLVVQQGAELPLPTSFVTRLEHSETGHSYNLVVALSEPSEHLKSVLHGLEPGIFYHNNTGKHYFLNGAASMFPEGDLGVWYTAMYKIANESPHFFRPLHTAQFTGWLQPGRDGERFTRLSTVRGLENPTAPDPSKSS